MPVTVPGIASRTTSIYIRDTHYHPKANFIFGSRSFSTRNTHQPYLSQFRSPRKRRRVPILGHFAFTTSSCLHEPSASEPTSRVPWPKCSNPSPYEIFNLPRTASQKEIKSRYFLLVKQYHPDHATHIQSSVERFRKVVEAYKILSNPSKRHEYDSQNPVHNHEPRSHSEFRQPWSGSRLSRRKTEQKGPPPSGGWSFSHPSRARPHVNMDYSQSYTQGDVDNAHFNYERHYRRNLEQEMKIKRKMDELHASRLEFERQREENKQSVRVGFAFTGALFLCILLMAKSMAPS